MSSALLSPQPVVLGSSSAQSMVVPGNLTVSGTVASASGIVDVGPLSVSGATTLGSTLNVAGPTALAGTLNVTGTTTTGNLNATANITTSFAFVSGSAANVGGSIVGSDGTNFVAQNHPQGLYVAPFGTAPGAAGVVARIDNAGALVANSVTATNNVFVGSGLYGSTLALPAYLPLGMIGGQNCTPYLGSQPTNGVDVQLPPVTWNGSPINIQLNSSVAANAGTFYNIVLPIGLLNSISNGKVIAYGLVYIGGNTGVTLNFYSGSVAPGNLLRQFGMQSATPIGSALRGFQCVYEPGNAYLTGTGFIQGMSFIGLDTQ